MLKTEYTVINEQSAQYAVNDSGISFVYARLDSINIKIHADISQKALIRYESSIDLDGFRFILFFDGKDSNEIDILIILC